MRSRNVVPGNAQIKVLCGSEESASLLSVPTTSLVGYLCVTLEVPLVLAAQPVTADEGFVFGRLERRRGGQLKCGGGL